MTTKAIFCECIENFWIEVASNLRDTYNWNPFYWTGSINENLIKEKFPDAVFHNVFDAMRGIPPVKGLDLDFTPIDEEITKKLAYHESIVLKMMDRMDPDDSFYYNERIRLYHTYLKYWLAVIEHYSPDVVVFHTIPHVVFNYVLYAICKLKKIKTVMFYFTIMEGVIFPMESIDSESEVVSEYKKCLTNLDSIDIQISDRAINHLQRLKGDYLSHMQAMPEDTKDKMITDESKEKQSNICTKLTSFLIQYPISFLKSLKFALSLLLSMNKPGKPNYQKRKGKKIEESFWTEFQYRWYQYKSAKKKQNLAKYYELLTEPSLNLKKPYIYVALHYQPELSTSPMGGVFVHQLAMVELLSKTIPENWHIIVKEHLWQNDPASHGERARTIDLYDDLISISNVTLASLSTPQWDLIDNAKAIATITGTVGWEAVVRSKPVFIFGHAWYKGCEGVFYTPSYNDCKQVIQKIIDGYVVSEEKVRLFVHVLEHAGLKAYGDSNFEQVSKIEYNDNISLLTEAIQKFYLQITL